MRAFWLVIVLRLTAQSKNTLESKYISTVLSYDDLLLWRVCAEPTFLIQERILLSACH